MTTIAVYVTDDEVNCVNALIHSGGKLSVLNATGGYTLSARGHSLMVQPSVVEAFCEALSGLSSYPTNGAAWILARKLERSLLAQTF